MEDDKLHNDAVAARQAYDKALLAYQKSEGTYTYWKVFVDELTKFATGSPGEPENARHQLVFEKASGHLVRRMPDALVKAALGLAKINGVTATRLALPNNLRAIPKWLIYLTELKNLEIGVNFNNSYIWLQHFPKLTNLLVRRESNCAC